eukprot:TRINITY_DN3128_c0_g1_i5.p1 TRINITY_DN3128_c0_g1~~TRINITY_DN3128_c0_g1_i5.p1  ORF type:complete len:280 (+),score=46.80 TRINITY_DN3128_c0_g1_i5:1-840(+)
MPDLNGDYLYIVSPDGCVYVKLADRSSCYRDVFLHYNEDAGQWWFRDADGVKLAYEDCQMHRNYIPIRGWKQANDEPMLATIKWGSDQELPEHALADVSTAVAKVLVEQAKRRFPHNNGSVTNWKFEKAIQDCTDGEVDWYNGLAFYHRFGALSGMLEMWQRWLHHEDNCSDVATCLDPCEDVDSSDDEWDFDCGCNEALKMPGGSGFQDDMMDTASCRNREVQFLEDASTCFTCPSAVENFFAGGSEEDGQGSEPHSGSSDVVAEAERGHAVVKTCGR